MYHCLSGTCQDVVHVISWQCRARVLFCAAGNYQEYFGMNTDVDAVVYLMLVNNLLHDLFPSSVVVGEWLVVLACRKSEGSLKEVSWSPPFVLSPFFHQTRFVGGMLGVALLDAGVLRRCVMLD
jgi:hypothetical protein